MMILLSAPTGMLNLFNTDLSAQLICYRKLIEELDKLKDLLNHEVIRVCVALSVTIE